MILDKATMKVLKDLCAVSIEMYFTDDTLRVASTNKQLMAYYDYGIKLNVPKGDGKGKEDGFGIGDVSELLGTLAVYADPKIKEGTDSLLISEGKINNNYRYTDKENILVPPLKKDMIDGPESKFGVPISTFDLSSASFKMITGQASVLKTPHIKIEGKSITALDTENTARNQFNLEIEVEDDIEKILMDFSNLSKMIPDDYTVEVTPDAVVFKGKTIPITYVVVALAQ